MRLGSPRPASSRSSSARSTCLQLPLAQSLIHRFASEVEIELQLGIGVGDQFERPAEEAGGLAQGVTPWLAVLLAGTNGRPRCRSPARSW